MLRIRYRADADAIRRTLDGIPNAFEPLVRRYWDTVYAICFAYTSNHSDAEDLTQEAFINAYTHLDRLRESTTFAAWLMTITRNRACRFRSTRRVSIPLNGTELTTEPQIEQREAIMEDNQIEYVLRAELKKLPDDHREVLTLHYFAGKDTAEIARLLDITREAVKKRLQRSRAILGERLTAAFDKEVRKGRLSEERVAQLCRAIVAVPVPWLKGGTATAALAPAILSASVIKTVGTIVFVMTVIAAVAVWKLPYFSIDATPAVPPAASVIVEASLGSVRTIATATSSTGNSPAASLEIASAVVTGPSLSGHVLDGTTRNPVTEFRVGVFYNPRAAIVYDLQEASWIPVNNDDGAFTIPLLSTGDLVLLVEAAGFYRHITTDVHIEAGESREGLVIPLAPMAPYHVQAVDMAGRGVGDVTIVENIRNPNADFFARASVATTDSSGGAILRAGQAPYPSLTASHPEYGIASARVTTEGAEFVVYIGGTIEGRVTVDGQPVANASLSAYGTTSRGASAMSRDDGTYVLEKVPPGDVNVSLMSSVLDTGADILVGMKDTQHRVRQLAKVEPNKTTVVDFSLSAATVIEGRITFRGGATGGPVQTSLSISDGLSTYHRTFYTDVDGNFRFTAHTVGTATLEARYTDDEYIERNGRVSALIEPGYTTTLDLDLGPGGRVSGTLLNTLPREPRFRWRDDWVMLLPIETGLTSLEAIESVTYAELRERAFGMPGIFDPPNFETPTVPPGRYILLALFVGPEGTGASLRERIANGLHAITEVEITDGQDLHVDLPLQPYPGH